MKPSATGKKETEKTKHFILNNTRDWQLALNALVSKYNQVEWKHHINVVNAEGEEVTIEVKPNTLELLQTKTFSSYESLLEALPYAPLQQRKNKTAIPYPPPKKTTNNGLSLLQQLFSETTLEAFALPITGQSSHWQDNNGVLFSEVKTGGFQHQHAQLTIQQLREALTTYSIDELRAAVAPTESKYYKCLGDHKKNALHTHI